MGRFGEGVDLDEVDYIRGEITTRPTSTLSPRVVDERLVVAHYPLRIVEGSRGRTPPSSPPFVEHDSPVARELPSPLTSRHLAQHLLSPEHARQPPPQTPASIRSRYRDNSSEYYTAAWGSPYERSPSLHTAPSEQAFSEDLLGSSPGDFGLEHLIPSRLVESSSRRPRDPTQSSAETRVDAEDSDVTPRSRTKRWVQLPRKEEAEKAEWWSDESQQGSPNRDSKRSRSVSSVSNQEDGKSLGHPSRESNRTLDQQTFWKKLREKRLPDMSLHASRWADTPPAEEDTEVPLLHEKPTQGLASSRWADTPPIPDTESEVMASGSTAGGWAEPLPQGTREDDNGADKVTEQDEPEIAPTEESKDDTFAAGAMNVPPVLAKTRSDAPRPKKKVSWRGKMCTILIPDLDYGASERQPMSVAQAEARFQSLEDQGYDIRGYDVAPQLETSNGPVHVKPIFPDEEEVYHTSHQEAPTVQLPDLSRWRAYMDQLTEQKLAALGVSLGGDEPVSVGAPDMSRQSSGQYPPLPFSPPIPSGSVASVGPPGMVRGHSHTMSVAAPMSPMSGPMGHMRTQSTFAGPFGFQQQADLNGLRSFSPSSQQLSHQPTLAGLRSFSPQSQQPLQQPGLPGMQPFSSHDQFAIPGLNRAGSPAQLAALRNSVGALRGPGSPLGQEVPAPVPQSYNRSFAQGPSKSAQNILSPHTLPELPEEDDEDELREPDQSKAQQDFDSHKPAYVPPHKRAELNADIAVPTPRGHHHNISEGLERDVLETEDRRKTQPQQSTHEETSDERSTVDEGPNALPASMTIDPPLDEKDPLSQGISVQESPNNHKRGGSKPRGSQTTVSTFKFNPGATFEPGASAFTFGAPAPAANGVDSIGHRRGKSSVTLNVAASEFKPSGLSAMPKSDFNFSSSGPVFKPDAAPFEPVKKSQNIVDTLPSIFGRVDIPSDIVKPAKKSKAVAIIRPDHTATKSGPETDFEDDEGRIAQSDERLKRQRKAGNDGDEVPRFAEITPLPMPSDYVVRSSTLDSVDEQRLPTVKQQDTVSVPLTQPTTHRIADVVDSFATSDSSRSVGSDVSKPVHGHKPSSSLSALAQPFNPFGSFDAGRLPVHQPSQSFASISELEEGELKDDDPAPSSLPGDGDLSAHDDRSISPLLEERLHFDQPVSARFDTVADTEPSFAEIDAVMRQLNEIDAPQDNGDLNSISPLSSTSLPPPIEGVTYLPAWSRSDAPSPSPKRQQVPFNVNADSSFTIPDRPDSVELPTNVWADINRLNKNEEVPTSDWSGFFSTQDEDKLQSRGHFFDSRIEELIGNAVERQLQPLEESLRAIEQTVSKRPISRDFPAKRSSSAIESDADDEDDSEGQRHRPISRGKDKRIDQIKFAILEAIREESRSQQSQSAPEIQELHAVLADMKMSFARTASAGLELEDIKNIVAEALRQQSQAMVPVNTNEAATEGAHKREVSELEGRLNETLAGALEEANRRHASEEREVEIKRMLRLAEEEVQHLRNAARDNDTRFRATEREREDLLQRLADAEDARRDAEDKVTDLEAEHEAAQGTLEEYRMSSSRWRQDIDEATRDRDEMENTISSLQHELEESQDHGTGMRRRLEKIQSDMATAAGQLVSEKAARQHKIDDLRSRCEQLEAQQVSQTQDRSAVEEELNTLRAAAAEGAEAKLALEQTKLSNATLEETVRKLQADLIEQQSLAARLERDSNDAGAAGQMELERVRASTTAEIESVNNQANIVRAELESELSMVRSQLENTKAEAEEARARHQRQLKEGEDAKHESIRQVNDAKNSALEETRQKYETSIQELKSAHDRTLSNAVEDKQRSEYFLNERLILSDAKLQHFQDRTLHLEERLEIAKSAAQAAVMKVQMNAVPMSSTSTIPEKISPQALRESILVLQEQLQERELTIDELRNQREEQASAETKKRDDEIGWLRELLAVRSEELTDLVNILAQPTFDRAAVRDTAIRIRANLQMEQHEKDRVTQGSSLPGQAIASLSNFATPKAAQLGAAFSKWRSTMESSSLRHAPSSRPRPRSSAPLKAITAVHKPPPGYVEGLMTPPASNLRSTPSPEAIKLLPQPRLHSSGGEQKLTATRPNPQHHQYQSDISDGPVTPLFRSQSYDQDAEDNSVHMQSFEDEDLDVADSQPPAFRSLEAELDSADDDIA